MTFRRPLVLVNRHCRHGGIDLSPGLAVLERAGMRPLLVATDTPDAIPDIVRRHAAEVDLVVAAGGDGTMNAVADPLIEHNLPMAILPLGTANDLARTLAIPLSVEEACRVVAEGVLHHVDLGRVNGKYFFNVASMGLSAHVSRQLTPQTKRRWGVFSYAISAWRAVRAVRPFRAEIRCDGKVVRTRSVQIAVGNGRHYGGGMTVADDAAIDDAQLHLYSLSPRRLLGYLLLYPALRRGMLKGWPGVRTLRGRRIEVLTRRRLPVNTDGELTTYTPALFEVVPAALRVVVPRQYLVARRGER